MRCTVRNAELHDIGAIAAIHVDSWNRAYKGLVPKELSNERTLEFRARQWSEAFRQGDTIILVACDEESSVRGFASASLIKSERFASYLETLYVAPEAWSMGIGSRLLSAVTKTLLSRATNTLVLRAFHYGRARAFYERLGAQRTSDNSAPQTRTDDVVLAFNDLNDLVKRVEALRFAALDRDSTIQRPFIE
jgi:GNAT superfamily N-acetyltransferase